jgi:hypothetical protein
MAQTLTTQVGRSVLLAAFFVRELCSLDATRVREGIRLGPVMPVRQGRVITLLGAGQILAEA